MAWKHKTQGRYPCDNALSILVVPPRDFATDEGGGERERRQRMKYSDGNEVRLGDRVRLGGDSGIVVASIDTREYSAECTEAAWSYLKRGVVIKFPSYGLIHYAEPEPDLELIARAGW
jgi:hypothetical protein